MFIYEGLVVQTSDDKFFVAILKLNPNEPGCDTVMERECATQEEASIWMDDEMNRLTTGKGVWDV